MQKNVATLQNWYSSRLLERKEKKNKHNKKKTKEPTPQKSGAS